MIVRNIFRFLISSSFIMLYGCSMAGGKFSPSTIHSLANDEILIVGKIMLNPPLRENEQKLSWSARDAFKDKAFVITGDKYRGFDEVDGFSMRHLAQVDIGKTFFYREDLSDRLIYSGAYIQTELYSDQSRRDGKIYLPGGLQFALNKGHRAIYIGTIKYHRDEYSAITKTEIIDEFNEANKDFKEKYGSSIKLTRVTANKLRSD